MLLWNLTFEVTLWRSLPISSDTIHCIVDSISIASFVVQRCHQSRSLSSHGCTDEEMTTPTATVANCLMISHTWLAIGSLVVTGCLALPVGCHTRRILNVRNRLSSRQLVSVHSSSLDISYHFSVALLNYNFKTSTTTLCSGSVCVWICFIPATFLLIYRNKSLGQSEARQSVPG